MEGDNWWLVGSFFLIYSIYSSIIKNLHLKWGISRKGGQMQWEGEEKGMHSETQEFKPHLLQRWALHPDKWWLLVLLLRLKLSSNRRSPQSPPLIESSASNSCRSRGRDVWLWETFLLLSLSSPCMFLFLCFPTVLNGNQISVVPRNSFKW